MIRTVRLIFQNEFRLLGRDRTALFMLILAPVVIITVAGFSLGSIFGSTASRGTVIAMVDDDHGAIARAIIGALNGDRAVTLLMASDLPKAREIVARLPRAPLVIVIPRETTAAFEAGGRARLDLYVDPVRRLEANAIELRLDDLCRRVMGVAQDRARLDLARQSAELRSRMERLGAQAGAMQAGLVQYRAQYQRSRIAARAALEAQMKRALAALEAQTQAAADRAIAQTRASLTAELSSRQDALVAVGEYLQELQASEHDFDRWLSALKVAAGSHAADIPAPPRWPAPPSQAQLALLSKPFDVPNIAPPAPPSLDLSQIPIKLPSAPALATPEFPPVPGELVAAAVPALPGDLGWREQSLTGAATRVNTFDQYVPGFGITFLMIDMLWGLAVGLIDERDWGTLGRLRVSTAPLAAMLIGKLAARFAIGVVQMVLLFSVGWMVFGISLGRSPAMLLVPVAAISFAAAAFSLLIASVAETRDSVLPIGAMAAMAMSAMGGCWWPLDFEPWWMRAVALWLPTTWTMRAFNDLMIRGLAPSSALRPAAITAGLAVIYLVIGIPGTARIYES
ncbi:MAG TPA: ABC transporter permease [Candidatus Binataceae bacterium]|nr:ABC transporter permease [Candidatus Binataceae bacterium]